LLTINIGRHTLPSWPGALPVTRMRRVEMSDKDQARQQADVDHRHGGSVNPNASPAARDAYLAERARLEREQQKKS